MGVLRAQAAFVLVFLAPVVHAQEAAARIVGTLTDPQGLPLPAAKVTVVNAASGLVVETATDQEGRYETRSLPIGTYTVSVEKDGFDRLLSAPLLLGINQSLRVDLRAKLGSVRNIVEVSDISAGVETVSAALGQSVISRQLINLPLNGRNALDLALLQPGVTQTNPDSTASGNFNISGGRSDSVTFLLDGGLNNNLLDNGVVLAPNPDTLAEFRILTSNYSAEYGRNAGGIITMVTKSGGNKPHGSAYDYLRNDAFNANTFFNNQQGLARPVLKRNQFGATLGGPITVPKVVQGKDRLFYFFGYQGQRQNATQLGPTAVPVFTPAELHGDFSHSGTNGAPEIGVAQFLATHPFFQPDSTLAAQAIIAPNRVNSVAGNFISAGLIPTSASGKVLPQGSSTENADEYISRMDFVISPNDRVAVTLAGSRAPSVQPFAPAVVAGPTVAGFPATNNFHRYFGSIAYTKIITPALVNDFRFTVQRLNNMQDVPASHLATPAELGVGITPDQVSGPPILYFGSGLQTGFSPLGPTALIDNTFGLAETLNWVRGSHHMKLGWSRTAYQNNTNYDYYGNGYFAFTGPVNAGGIGSGNSFADFLLGLPDQYYQFASAPSNIRTAATAVFAHDEWRAAKGLTLTLGLRYEYGSPKRDLQGRSYSLALERQSVRFPNAPLGLLFPGDPGAPEGANFPDKNDWAPRFGFAWDPFSSNSSRAGGTGIRGGFGVFYDILKAEDSLQFNGQAPFFGGASLTFDPLGGNPSAEVNYLSQPFAATRHVNPFPSRPPSRGIDFGAAGFLPFGGSSIYFVNPHLRTPYIFQYNLSLQQRLPSAMVAEVSYSGSSSHKLTAVIDVNPFVPGTGSRLFNLQAGLSADTGFKFLDSFENAVNAGYNSLQASLQKRLSSARWFGNSYFTLAYTLAHNIDNASGFRERTYKVPYYNHNQFRSDADADVRHSLVFSGGWDLPLDLVFTRAPRKITQGWSLYPIISFRTGFSLDIFAGFSQTADDPGPSGAGDAIITRANLVGAGVRLFNPRQTQSINGSTGNFYFDPRNFSAPDDDPSLRTYGTLPRNAFRGPGRVNADIAVVKHTPIQGDHIATEFRAEFFNVWNHAEFGNPSLNLNSSEFGQVSTTSGPRIIQLAFRLTF